VLFSSSLIAELTCTDKSEFLKVGVEARIGQQVKKKALYPFHESGLLPNDNMKNVASNFIIYQIITQ